MATNSLFRSGDMVSEIMRGGSVTLDVNATGFALDGLSSSFSDSDSAPTDVEFVKIVSVTYVRSSPFRISNKESLLSTTPPPMKYTTLFVLTVFCPISRAHWLPLTATETQKTVCTPKQALNSSKPQPGFN